MKLRLAQLILIVAALMLLTLGSAGAVNINVAVRAHLALPAQEIAAPLKPKTRHEALVSYGTSRSFYIQTIQADAIQVSLPADDSRPSGVIGHGAAVPPSNFTCPIGGRASRNSVAALMNDTEALKMPRIIKPMVCNPAPAPYGTAAGQTSSSSETSWPAGSIVMLGHAVVLIVTLIERYRPGTST
ncbi:ABC-type molybdate transport system substrate-binding protein [Bradyrhizobium macuxiense]|uniref:ABC-type molybdate transport system substrate-binding protein n=1 Tax=Bradyrhizobium macuxiense TaxID=1755647 RepID=A0A560L221_9BRAD|nr:substrate-binding domain-containing protein [Bradyrhizobium macuxiense]TWB89455.1 ABC-type molybdate transport system substrate-binding protein [Bradyrhizobium macuxiense]